MSTTPTPACRVVRCITPAAYAMTVSDDGHTVTSGTYCAQHAGQKVASLARPGRHLVLDVLDVQAVAR